MRNPPTATLAPDLLDAVFAADQSGRHRSARRFRRGRPIPSRDGGLERRQARARNRRRQRLQRDLDRPGPARDRRPSHDDRSTIRRARRPPPTTSGAAGSPTSSPSCRATRSRRSRKIAGDFDFVFLDAWKRDYKRFFDLVFPRLRPRGLFLAHNVVNKQTEMRDFLAAIQNNPALFTTIVTPSGRKECRSRTS